MHGLLSCFAQVLATTVVFCFCLPDKLEGRMIKHSIWVTGISHVDNLGCLIGAFPGQMDGPIKLYNRVFGVVFL